MDMRAGEVGESLCSQLLTIDAMSDGKNKSGVWGGEDDEEIPCEGDI